MFIWLLLITVKYRKDKLFVNYVMLLKYLLTGNRIQVKVLDSNTTLNISLFNDLQVSEKVLKFVWIFKSSYNKLVLIMKTPCQACLNIK